jgi:hypothetical protein
MTVLQKSSFRCVLVLGFVGPFLESGANAQLQIPVTVNGTINYTGRTGNEGNDNTNAAANFPARGVKVEIWDANPGDDALLSTVWTNNSGAYSAVVEGLDSDGLLSFSADVYIRVFPETQPQLPTTGGIQSNHRVRQVTSSDSFGRDVLGSTYRFTSATQMNIPGAATINQNFGASGNLAWSFSVFDAMQEASRYYSSLPGSVNNSVDTAFPSTESTSNFSSNRLHILRGDRFDWDVSMHEYGHFVQSLHAGISNSPNGNHNLVDNLRFLRTGLNRLQADQLAWGEAWPTYFAISGQQQLNSAALGIQRVGDVIYHDNDDTNGTNIISPNRSLRMSLEQQSIGGPSRGEDNEASITRILFDLYDSTNDAGDRDRVALGDTAIWNLIRTNTTATLDTFWDALIGQPSITNTTRINYGAIFQAHNVSPAPNPASVNGDLFPVGDVTPPTFSWTIPQGGITPTPTGGGGFTNNLLNNFGVKIFASDDTEVWDSGLLGNVTSWTPAAVDWFTFTSLPADFYRWITYGQMSSTETRNVGTPFTYTTGNYWSDALGFSVGLIPEPGSMALVCISLCGALLRGPRMRSAAPH